MAPPVAFREDLVSLVLLDVALLVIRAGHAVLVLILKVIIELLAALSIFQLLPLLVQ